MLMQTLAKAAEREEIDYQFLLSMLVEYARPRDKISGWLKAGDLIRVKKGLYVLGEHVALGPYSHEVLANLIYGPSAISLNYALSFYGLIPERITTITSITPKRNKFFATPVGDFRYHYLPVEKYAIGIELIQVAKQKHVLMASPEKALCDYIYLVDKTIPLTHIDEMEAYLLHDLRIDEQGLRSFKKKRIAEISNIYNDKRLYLLNLFIKQWK